MANNQKQAETIRSRGALAFRSGQSLDDCPYTIPTKQGQKFARLWCQGFCDAQQSVEGSTDRVLATEVTANER